MSEVVAFRKRRGVELVMLILAMGLVTGTFVLTNLNLYGELPEHWWWGVAGYAGIGLIAHGVIRWRTPYADPLLFPLVYLLNGLGLAMIYRLDQGTRPVMHSAELQLVWTAISVGVFIVVLVLLRDHRSLQRFPYLSFLAGLTILMLPLVPGLGRENFGARIWIKIGSYSFQPAELAKIVLAVAFASYLVEKKDVLALAGARVAGIDLPRARDLGPIIIMWLASLAVLIYQKDLGTSLLFFGLFVMMLFVATSQVRWVIIGVSAFAVAAYVIGQLAPHVATRVSSWLDPFSNYEANYQIITAQFGMAWGGLFGRGWGQGRPGLTPVASSDFISAAIGEELGLVGLVAVILIYLLMVARGLRAALTSTVIFGKLLASGFSFIFALQIFAIIGGVTRLLPLTGLTTPFMSQGGSSLVANWLIVAILLLISHQARRPQVATVPATVANLADDETSLINLNEGTA